MNTNDIEDMFINPTAKIGYGLYAIRKSIIKAVSDLRGNIFGNVLDLGCGVMPYKNFLTSNGNIDKYIGVDLKHSDYHNQVTPDLYWDGITIPVANNSQDWVIVTEFLEHYYDTRHILQEIKRVLKPNGKVFFTLPCIYMLHEVPFDYHRFTPYSIEKLFKETNFTEVNIFPLGGFNYSMVIMMSLWNKKSGVRGLPRLLSKLFLYLFHKQLLAVDTVAGNKNMIDFSNNQMLSGLWGYGQK